MEDAGQALGVSARTVKREWSCARAWLFKSLQGEGSQEQGASDDG